MRLNHLYPPFNNVEGAAARCCTSSSRTDVMGAIFGSEKYVAGAAARSSAAARRWRTTQATGWFKEGQNVAKAKELFGKSGYDGKPVVVLQATDHYLANPAGLFIAQWLRQAGVNVDLAAMDWGAVSRAAPCKKPPAEGGWNLFSTTVTGLSLADPIAFVGHAAKGDKGWFGWPTNELQEKLRDKWALAPTLDARKQVAREMQKNAWDFVPHLYLRPVLPQLRVAQERHRRDRHAGGGRASGTSEKKASSVMPPLSGRRPRAAGDAGGGQPVRQWPQRRLATLPAPRCRGGDKDARLHHPPPRIDRAA